MRIALSRTRDGIWVARDEVDRPLGSFFAEGDGWWSAYLVNGTRKRLWVPDGGHEEVARRIFRDAP